MRKINSTGGMRTAPSQPEIKRLLATDIWHWTLTQECKLHQIVAIPDHISTESVDRRTLLPAMAQKQSTHGVPALQDPWGRGIGRSAMSRSMGLNCACP